MNLVSDEMIRRAAAFAGRPLTPAESDEFRRMSELIKRGEDDVAWTIVLAMWAARVETTAALNGAGDAVRSGLEAWMERVASDMETIDANRRSMTQEVVAAAQNNTAAISAAAKDGIAALAARLAGLEGQVAAMMATVDRAMKGASGALAAAKKRDVDVEAQIKTLADGYARKLSDGIEARARAALEKVERRLEHAAAQAGLAAKPLLVLAVLALVFLALGSISTALVFICLVPRG